MEYNRSELRKIIMTALYQISLYEQNNIFFNIEEIINNLLEVDNEFVKNTVNNIIKDKKAIDKIANENLKNWDITRLGKTDQAILRLGIYELLYTDTPDIVCINEAVELSKIYSDDDVRKMINGVLDKIYNNK